MSDEVLDSFHRHARVNFTSTYHDLKYALDVITPIALIWFCQLAGGLTSQQAYYYMMNQDIGLCKNYLLSIYVRYCFCYIVCFFIWFATSIFTS